MKQEMEELEQAEMHSSIKPPDMPPDMGYVPAKSDIRPMISCRECQCLSKAKEVLRAKPETLPRLRESTAWPPQ